MIARLPTAAAIALLAGACASSGGGGGAPVSLLQPEHPAFQEMAPDSFRVRFETSRGDFVVAVTRAWAPRGADRFYNLVRHGFYDGNRFFRVLSGFVAQFGMHGNPAVTEAWYFQRLQDDPVTQSNTAGTISFATAGPNTRTTQLFINLADNSRLDALGFAPFGRVVEGMTVVQELHAGYGEGAPVGSGPDQERIRTEGNAYLERDFPALDHIRRARIVE